MEYLEVSMGWRLPDGNRVKATFDTRFVAYEESYASDPRIPSAQPS